MGGCDADAGATPSASMTHSPVVVVALGRHDPAAQLPEPALPGSARRAPESRSGPCY